MKKIVLLGGGSGISHLIKTLKKDQKITITAIISTSDNGKSTGMLRRSYDIPAIGDIRKNLWALSEIENNWLEYRFEGDFLEGHPVGNLWLLGLIKNYGFRDGLRKAHQLLGIEKHKILPTTTENHDMLATLENETLVKGEWDIDKVTRRIKTLKLSPRVIADRDSLNAIKAADMILVGPGTFHTSIISCFLTEGIYEAFCASKAKKVYIANLSNSTKQYNSYTLQTYIDEFDRLIGTIKFDTILAHDGTEVNAGEKIEANIGNSEIVIDNFRMNGTSHLHDTEKVLQWINKNI